jgi:hypothetical protein
MTKAWDLMALARVDSRMIWGFAVRTDPATKRLHIGPTAHFIPLGST